MNLLKIGSILFLSLFAFSIFKFLYDLSLDLLFDTAGKGLDRNKKILLFLSLFAVLSCFAFVLMTSQYIGAFAFQPIYAPKTGHAFSAIESILLYILFAFIFGGIPSTSIAVFSVFACFFLHRGERYILGKENKKFEKDLSFGIGISLLISYSAVFLLLLLHICGIFSIEI